MQGMGLRLRQRCWHPGQPSWEKRGPREESPSRDLTNTNYRAKEARSNRTDKDTTKHRSIRYLMVKLKNCKVNRVFQDWAENISPHYFSASVAIIFFFFRPSALATMTLLLYSTITLLLYYSITLLLCYSITLLL